MTSNDSRAKARECYRVAQKTAHYDARHLLLRLVVQWRELAALMDRLNRDDPPFRVARTLH
jgi:hypothetical protein